MIKQTEYRLNKLKIFKFFCISLVFVAFLLFSTIFPEKCTSTRCSDPNIIQVTGVIGLIIFGPILIIFTIKTFDKTPALIINKHGIINNTNLNNIGPIKWHDIKTIKRSKYKSTERIAIILNSPEKYLKQNNNRYKKMISKSNMKHQDIPIIINTEFLLSSQKDIIAQIKNEHKKHQTLQKNKTHYNTVFYE